MHARATVILLLLKVELCKEAKIRIQNTANINEVLVDKKLVCKHSSRVHIHVVLEDMSNWPQMLLITDKQCYRDTRH